ncbi:3-oxoacyl-ACP reductase [Thermoplasmatales archaeon ex4484_30]|nr:MAG: 3-oxoacyl-ACP reductase [Thermoplasmatales archaeon ex4484_30]
MLAVVTGGDRGIGKAIAKMLAKEGYKVIFTYRSREKEARKTLEELKKYGNVECYKMDVSNWDEVKNIFHEIGEGIHVLVNNAGIVGMHTSLDSITIEDWKRVIDVNLTGAFYCCKASFPYLKKAKGCIINISSIAGKMGGTLGVHYASSKAGIIGLTFALASELAEYGIRVNAIAPGPVDTELLDKDTKEKLKELSPLKRIAKPEEIAHAVKFLIENEYITGEVIDVNGGRYMD